MEIVDKTERLNRRRSMKLDKVLPMIVGVLATALVAQVAERYLDKPGPMYLASWKETPKNMTEATRLARTIVTGVVTEVERANDLVVEAPGEPNNEDRIPIEVVTIKVEKAHKGEKPEIVQVFRTGSTKDPGLKDRPAPPGRPPPKPPGGVDRPAPLPRPTEAQTRTILLEDDPPYKVGERQLLLLTDGPTVTVAGASVKTQRPISPEGRYRIKPDNKIEPVAIKGFAAQLKNKPVPEFERLLR
jgi:hypothetical protein